jgi:hypothetical protein
MARDPKTFADVPGLADGTIFEPRWVVTDRGVMLTNLECASCHARVMADRTMQYGGPLATAPAGVGRVGARNAFGLGQRSLQRSFGGERVGVILKRMFDVPWDPDPRMEQLSTLAPGEAQRIFFNPHGVIPRNNGSAFYGTRVPDLHLLRYNRWGVWYRPRLLHDASIVTLEELFDAARLSADYERKGWSPPGVTKGAVPSLEFLTKLTPEEKTALIAFLRSL